MTWWQVIGLCLSLIVSAIIIAWKGFFKKYGETTGDLLSMKHNIDLILEQQKRTTEVTETIKSELSDRSLAKQRREEMKRDAALDIMRAYGSLLEASYKLFDVSLNNPIKNLPDDIIDMNARDRDEKWKVASDKFQAHMTTLWQLEQIAKLIFSETIQKQIDSVKKSFNSLRDDVYENATNFLGAHGRLKAEQEKLSVAIKAELEI